MLYFPSKQTEALMRILVVDDSDDARELTEAALISAGYNNLLTASSGWDALKTLDVGSGAAGADAGVDLVLLDIVMPKMDGIETCARVRNDPRHADLPIIMVTSLDDMDSLANAFVAGATDYVTKPVNRVELVARVRAALKLKSELDRRLERERELLTFLSSWGDRRATLWIDDATGLFVGEVAEAYLTASAKHRTDEIVSIAALTLDRFEAYRAARGDRAAQQLLARVAQALAGVDSTLGAVMASYRNGLFLLVLPQFDQARAGVFGETLRQSVSALRLPSSESATADYVTASIAVVTGAGQQGVDRVKLLTRAISDVQDIAAAGGDRVAAMAM